MSAYAAILYARRHFNIMFKDPHVINTRYEPDLEDMESGLPVYREDPVIEAPAEKGSDTEKGSDAAPAETDPEALTETSASACVTIPESQERPNWVSKVFSAVSSVFRWRK